MSINADPHEPELATDAEIFGEMTGVADGIINRYLDRSDARERRRNLCALAAPMIAAELQGSRSLSFDPEKVAKAAQKQLASIEELLADAEQLGVDVPTSAMLRTRSLRVPPRPSREEMTLVQMINYLRREEGDAFTLLCDNPDPEDANNNAVIAEGSWTGWTQRRFEAVNLLEAVRVAYEARCEFDRVDSAHRINEQPTSKPTNNEAEQADTLLDASRGADGLYA